MLTASHLGVRYFVSFVIVSSFYRKKCKHRTSRTGTPISFEIDDVCFQQRLYIFSMIILILAEWLKTTLIFKVIGTNFIDYSMSLLLVESLIAECFTLEVNKWRLFSLDWTE